MLSVPAPIPEEQPCGADTDREEAPDQARQKHDDSREIRHEVDSVLPGGGICISTQRGVDWKVRLRSM